MWTERGHAPLSSTSCQVRQYDGTKSKFKKKISHITDLTAGRKCVSQVIIVI